MPCAKKYFHIALERIERRTGNHLRIESFIRRPTLTRISVHDYNAYKGNAYGLPISCGRPLSEALAAIFQSTHLVYAGQLTCARPWGAAIALFRRTGRCAAPKILSKSLNQPRYDAAFQRRVGGLQRACHTSLLHLFFLSHRLLHTDMRAPIHGIYGFVRFRRRIVDTFTTSTRLRSCVSLIVRRGKPSGQVFHLIPSCIFPGGRARYNIPHDLIRAFLHSMALDLQKTTYRTDEELGDTSMALPKSWADVLVHLC
jgi:hypothetical protein